MSARDRTAALVTLLALAVPAAAPGAPFAYVPNEGSATISVIDTATDLVVDTLRIGSKPRGIAVSRDGERLFVSDQSAKSLVVVDIAAPSNVAKIPLGDSPEAIYLSSDGRWLSASAENADSIDIFDVAGGELVGAAGRTRGPGSPRRARAR